MKLYWFFNDKALFTTEGDVPLIGQTVYAHDYSTTPPGPKKKYVVKFVDRSITLRTINTSSIKLESKSIKDRTEELVDTVSKTYECYVDEIRPGEMKITTDHAEVHLIPYGMQK
jgi:hypothetical protein